jgi:hypothetical protein
LLFILFSFFLIEIKGKIFFKSLLPSQNQNQPMADLSDFSELSLTYLV